MRYRGHIDALRNQVLDGWAADLQALDHPVFVELLIDGAVVAEAVADRYRADLKEAGIGTGRHGFMIAIPDAFFDDRNHSVGARIKAPRQILFDRRNLVGKLDEVRLNVAQRPAFVGAVTGIEKGVLLRGFAHNSSTGSDPLLVELTLDGEVIAQARASGSSPGDRAPPPNCGFSFDLASAWRPDLLSGKLECRIAGTGVAFSAVEAIRNAISELQVRIVDDRLKGAVRLPAFLPAATGIDLRLNGTLIEDVNWRSTPGEHGGTLRQFSTRLTVEQTATPPLLEIRLRDLDCVVGGGARELVSSSPNLVANALFQAWVGDRPADWRLCDETIARLVPEHCLLDMTDAKVPVFGPVAVRFELRAPLIEPEARPSRAETAVTQLIETEAASGPEANVVLFSQSLAVNELSPGEELEWILVACNSRHVEGSVVLKLQDREGVWCSLRSPLSLIPRWSQRSGSFFLPASDQVFENAELALELPGGAHVFRVAVIGLGKKGFDLAPKATSHLPDDVAEGTAAHPNAVCNGDFGQWSRGLKFSAGSKRFETADGWFFYSKTVQPSVAISVEKVVTRDPASVESTKEVYGLGLQGSLKSPCRLEVALDLVSLRAAAPERLRFYACRKQRQRLLGPDDGEQSRSVVGRILIVRRTTHPAGGDSAPVVSDESICTIARKVVLSPVGRHYEFRLPALERDWRELLSNLDLSASQGCQFMLLFEFDGVLDCVLAEVALLAEQRSSEAVREPGFVGLEDPNIASQLHLIKALADWARPQSIRLPSLSESAAGRRAKQTGMAARWALPQPGFPSVEIIIPIFNAREETLACLHSIERNTSVPYLLTLVDDASDPATALPLAEFAKSRPWVKLIRNESNLGYTRSSNLGMARSYAQWLLLLNSDVLVSPRWLEGLFECALSDPSIKFVGALSNAASWQSVPEVFDARGKFKVNALPEGWSVEDFAALVERESQRAFPRVPLLNGFCTLMERQAVEYLGYLDEVAFPVGFGEENDLCIRAVKAGHELAIADHVYVYHEKSASFGSERRDALSKQGTQQLILKHPDTDLQQAQEKLRYLPSLAELRRALVDRLAISSARSA